MCGSFGSLLCQSDVAEDLLDISYISYGSPPASPSGFRSKTYDIYGMWMTTVKLDDRPVLQNLHLGGTIRHVRRSRWKKTTKSLQIRHEWSLHSSQGRNSEGEEFSLVRPRGSCSKNAGMWKSKFYPKKTIAVSQNRAHLHLSPPFDQSICAQL